MSFIEGLLEEFYQYVSQPENELANLFLRLSDGSQVIVGLPQLEGDKLAGRDLMFSTGLWVRKDGLNASQVIWGTPIDFDACEAMISDWKAAGEARGRERAINYLERVGISGTLAEKVIELLGKTYSKNELEEVIDYLDEVTLVSGYKIEGDDSQKIAEETFHRLKSRL